MTTDKEGYKGISYEKLTPVLVEAVKELKSMFDADHAEIARLKAENENLRAENAKFEAYIKAHP